MTARHCLHTAIIAASLAGAVGCGGSPSQTARSPVEQVSGPINPIPIEDAEFAAATHKLLVADEGTSARINLLAGVVQQQLKRARRRFAAGHPTDGLRAVSGALYLIRVGQLRSEMVDGQREALLAAANEVARLGDEGRALALYQMLLEIMPKGQERRDVEQHIQALQAWLKADGQDGPMETLGGEQRTAMHRALYMPTVEAVEQAEQVTIQWIQRALKADLSEPSVQSQLARDELVEAFRAIRSGGISLMALHLRNGTPGRALDVIDEQELQRVIPPSLMDRLQGAAEDNDPQAWAELHELFESIGKTERPELALSPELADGATWGAAVSLYRAQPTSAEAGFRLASELVEHGMAEVAPLVLRDAIGESPSSEALSAALGLTLNAAISEDASGQLAAARRTIENALPLIRLAAQKPYADELRPSAARMHYVIGALEMRGGELARALPHMRQAAKSSPTPAVLRALAAIHWQRGHHSQALDALDRIIALAAKSGDLHTEAQAWLTSFEVHRDANQPEPAKSALEKALKRALDARRLASVDSRRAQAERLLARTLEHYGDRAAARRATKRALEASRTNPRELVATILDASRRALTLGDLHQARNAVHQAMEANLPEEDLVYVALWLDLLQKRLGVAGDGTVEEALSLVDDSKSWPSKLKAWARGKLNDEELLQAARDRAQKVEALFYSAMSEPKTENARAKLARVASSEAIELIEVKIARDLVADQRDDLKLNLPSGVSLP